ncbi:MAG: hypothetical protein ACOCZ5_00735 [bacterium]
MLISEINDRIISNPNFDISERYSDGGYDFLINGKKIDVKSLDERRKNRVYFKINNVNYDYMCLMFVDENKASYVGFISREDALKFKKYDGKNNCYYIHINKFKKN